MLLSWLRPNSFKTPHIIGLKITTHVVCLYLLIEAFYLAFTDQIGGDPVQSLTHFTGLGGLILMLITLAVTPLTRYLRQGQLMRMRRLLGLYAFAYACCHIYVYLAYDLIFNWSLLVEEIIKRPYITVGFVAFIILTALAITSIPSIMKKMGKRWKTLHNLIYLAAILICVHFLWSVKADITEPLLYMGILAVMLFFRWEKLMRYWRKISASSTGSVSS